MKYFKKILVEAVQYRGDNFQELFDFTNGQIARQGVYSSLILNNQQVNVGDYVIKQELGFVVQKPNIFESNHEKFQHKSNLF